MAVKPGHSASPALICTQQLPFLASPAALAVKNLPAKAGDIRDAGSTPGSGRSPGKGNGNPLQYSFLEKLTDGGAWGTAGHSVTKSWIRLR